MRDNRLLLGTNFTCFHAGPKEGRGKRFTMFASPPHGKSLQRAAGARRLLFRI
jgi:hypothetical protein